MSSCTIATLGNYDYIIDWVLTEGGTIRIDVGATGIVQVKGVNARTMADGSASRDTAYGNLIAANLVGVRHDHFLSFRLDVDIDGPRNTLVEQKAVPQRLPHSAGRRSLWRLIGRDVKTEGALHEAMSGTTTLWRVENRRRVNGLGQHPGYELRPGHIVTSLLAPDDIAQRRAAFSAAPLWVTAVPMRGNSMRPACTQIKASGTTDCLAMRRNAARSPIPISYCGIRWGFAM